MERSIDTALNAANASYLEEMLRRYLEDPASVDAGWRAWFESDGRALAEGPTPVADPGFASHSIFDRATRNGFSAEQADLAVVRAQGHIFQLINAYRVRGHLAARLDPLGLWKRPEHPELDPFYWGFTEADLDRTFSTVFLKGPDRLTLRDLVAHLRETYSRTIGVEFMHIHDTRIKEWLQERFERTRNHCRLDRDTMVFILEKLTSAEAFEDFLHTKYRGSKRFSLQGAESIIPTLALMIEDAGRIGVREIVMGMAHRGRLNVLVNILGKEPRWVFREFDDPDPQGMFGRGDVKYHLGHSSDVATRFGDTVHLSLTFNPSHLEAVNPVVIGRVRAKQDRHGDVERARILPVLIHGDAAFAGQGVVAETFNMMALDAYGVGGTIHLVINNQIGFTTDPAEGRSTQYCTALARMVGCPIIHVNGEDPEAVIHAAQVATEYRQTFHRDIVIDMYCFRRFGHNEGDEPTFTQPVMYREIAAHPAVHEVYGKMLVKRGVVEPGLAEEIFARKQQELDEGLEIARAERDKAHQPAAGRAGAWTGRYFGGPDAEVPEVDTALSEERFCDLVRGIVRVPDGFHVHPKLERLLAKRAEVLEDPESLLDWGMGELLAYASLVTEGQPVRMSGQDVQRGTFSHRHAVLTDIETSARYSPLDHLAEDQARFEIYNSLLSEMGVLGFEFGFSLDRPEGIVIWEAQFGDFVNGAQVIIDQFISASEDKWNRLSGLTMLLPHGYEGQGPEHSSARLERFLQLCAEDNMQVANVTTPSQMFHMLRRQALRPWRKPLIVMTPKSLLRHKLATSTMGEFTSGSFKRVIGEERLDDLKAVDRAVLCSGKIYYDLLERREAVGDTRTALIRLEQFYPFPEAGLLEALAALGGKRGVRELIWCQEEPENMGARHFLYPHFARLFAKGPALRWVCRDPSASPATGSPKAHRIEQEALLDSIFGQGES
ncbi:MAG: 2-oxoglutarate dehydrogenase E1 component [Deltaproteobacteria bacterium]|nr:2-oxoglutarate dehydrogenase E1 component [Deltaproteobacteria bacterium]MCB9786041.1 2-oxoglutarate dehydrogenase E1 component [Deltaproteobacteria bacterium]